MYASFYSLYRNSYSIILALYLTRKIILFKNLYPFNISNLISIIIHVSNFYFLWIYVRLSYMENLISDTAKIEIIYQNYFMIMLYPIFK